MPLFLQNLYEWIYKICHGLKYFIKPIDTNETSTELTHEEVIELFEEACKEIDEWKPNNQKDNFNDNNNNNNNNSNSDILVNDFVILIVSTTTILMQILTTMTMVRMLF